MESTAALSSKVAAIEDEMRIIKGEVKQVLTEIRSAILVQDNPFEEASNKPRAVQIVPAMAEEPARVEIVMPQMEPQPAVIATAVPHPDDPTPVASASPASQHVAAAPVRQEPTSQTSAPGSAHQQAAAPMHAPSPRWSLLTVASLAAWAEEALQKVGSKRLAMLLDLCEVSGYLTPDARQALARVGDLDTPEPAQPASPMDVTLLLRQLDALLQGEPSDLGPRLMY